MNSDNAPRIVRTTTPMEPFSHLLDRETSWPSHPAWDSSAWLRKFASQFLTDFDRISLANRRLANNANFCNQALDERQTTWPRHAVLHGSCRPRGPHPTEGVPRAAGLPVPPLNRPIQKGGTGSPLRGGARRRDHESGYALAGAAVSRSGPRPAYLPVAPFVEIRAVKSRLAPVPGRNKIPVDVFRPIPTGTRHPWRALRQSHRMSVC